MQDYTYSNLLTLIPSWAERRDTAFADQCPNFISLAENRIAVEVKQQGFESVVTGTLPLDSVLAKPSFWRANISFYYTDATTSERTPIVQRSLEYVRNYWPNPALTGSPRFYADYNASNFLLAPTPSAALAFELAYFARLQPLSATNDSNWMTLNMPQALFAACMVEAARFAKNVKQQAVWEDMYQGAIGGLKQENAERQADRNVVYTRP